MGVTGEVNITEINNAIKDTLATVESSTVKPVDISGSANQVSMDFNLQVAETVMFDGDWANRKTWPPRS